MKTTLARIYLALEFAVLFLGIPTLYYLLPGRPLAIPLLLAVTAACLVMLLADKSFDRKCLWNRAALGREKGRIAATFLVAAIILTALLPALWPEFTLQLLREYPLIWAFVMVLYPVLSVYPQELLYRAFLFHRYKNIFPTERGRIVISAFAFGYLHIIFQNPVAVILTIAGGFLFAWNYSRTKSLLSASLEHALYGCYIFTAGYGAFFYTGTRALAAAAAARIIGFN